MLGSDSQILITAGWAQVLAGGSLGSGDLSVNATATPKRATAGGGFLVSAHLTA